eukprot:TRINITY_DN45848_c0_g1_i1.p1 TRINITY_DN45848_c0_g1~~TRINITY_DN45848_c0_g1_i1.p1  ORF type:complete len:334 (-),score=63.53 TRINITY_DN45848_c0_g1_i1:697-1698(-)
MIRTCSGKGAAAAAATVLLLTVLAIPSSVSLMFDGINYSPYDSASQCVSIDQFVADMDMLSAVAVDVRIYSLVTCGIGAMLCDALPRIQSQFTSFYLGMWVSSDPASFQQELGELLNIAQTCPTVMRDRVSAIVVGSESLWRNDATYESLQAAFQQVRELIPEDKIGKKIFVTTSDVFTEYLFAPDEFINSVDLVMVNVFPFWEGVQFQVAGQRLWDHVALIYQRVSALNKAVVVGETGWPYGGKQVGNALTGQGQQRTYIKDVTCPTPGSPASKSKAQSPWTAVFWFEAFDSTWKSTTQESPTEQYFGLFSSSRQAHNWLMTNGGLQQICTF